MKIYKKLVLLFFIPLSLFSESIQSNMNPGSKPLNKTDYIDSEQSLKTLSSDLQTLYENGKTAKMEVLLKHLSRTCCGVQLSSAPGTTMSPVDLFEQKKKAVVVVGSLYKCEKCTKWHIRTASGFLVTSTGIMVTNYHVVDSSDTVAMGVMMYDGKVYPIRDVLAADKVADIAVLQLEGSGFPCLSLSPDNPIGTKICIISNPKNQLYTLTEGIISAQLVNTDEGVKSKRISVTADFAAGSSGAPIFNEQGIVVGMVASTQAVQSSNCSHGYAQMVYKHCVPSELILDLLADK